MKTKKCKIKNKADNPKHHNFHKRETTRLIRCPKCNKFYCSECDEVCNCGKIIINREELIEQINVRLHSTSTDEETFKVSNIIFKTRLFVKDHVLVSRL